jgi:signal transduction histidine kinase
MNEEQKNDLELLKKNEELKILNEELDTFVYRSSHDLRAPLTSVLGLSSLIENETDLHKIYYLNFLIKESVERLLKVTDDMADYSRNARTHVQEEEVDFSELIDEAIASHHFMENFHRLKINLDIQIPGKTVKLDKRRIAILVNNSLSNAIKYQDTNKEYSFLNISALCENNTLKLIFEDNGVGISEEYHDKIFEMFYRANAYSLGSGLGLYIVKGIVEKLNGKAEVISAPEKGTTFIFTFPLNQKSINK